MSTGGGHADRVPRRRLGPGTTGAPGAVGLAAMQIAYITPLQDHTAGRNVYYHIGRALEQVGGVTLCRVGPFFRSHDVRLYARWAWHNLIERKTYRRQHDPIELRAIARQLERALSALSADCAFCPNPMFLAYLGGDWPCAFWHDATYANLVDFYFQASKTSRTTLRHGHAHDRRALERCAVAIYASQWAADSAIRDYGTPPEKVKVVPRGASTEHPLTRTEVPEHVEARDRKTCRLLLVGVEWFRKGADIAVTIAERLNKNGLRAELDIVGCRPPSGTVLPDCVRLQGYLRKTVPGEASTLRALYLAAHFFVMPSRAECQGIAFCEASAFGLPSLGLDVGGVSDAVRDGVNGRLFPLGCDPSDCAAWIAELWNDPERYRELALLSYSEYETRLNWRTSAEKVVGHLTEALGRA